MHAIPQGLRERYARVGAIFEQKEGRSICKVIKQRGNRLYMREVSKEGEEDDDLMKCGL